MRNVIIIIYIIRDNQNGTIWQFWCNKSLILKGIENSIYKSAMSPGLFLEKSVNNEQITVIHDIDTIASCYHSNILI